MFVVQFINNRKILKQLNFETFSVVSQSRLSQERYQQKCKIIENQKVWNTTTRKTLQ